jgi:hypothetical protein
MRKDFLLKLKILHKYKLKTTLKTIANTKQPLITKQIKENSRFILLYRLTEANLYTKI